MLQTIADPVKALPKRPGPLFMGFFMRSKLPEATALLKGLEQILEEARKHAHVVLFTPHWGDNWLDKPGPTIRALARKILALGYDGILGHSAHVVQGVEIIDGKPVIYDAGNMLLDYGGGRGAGKGMLWKLMFNRAGVTQIIGHPIHMHTNYTVMAAGKVQREILKKVHGYSKQLGTNLDIEGGTLVGECKPGHLKGPSEAKDPPRRPVRKIRRAPSDTILDQLPKTANKVDVRYPEGIRLVGYELLIDEHSVPKSGQFIILYWTTDREIKNSYTVHLESRANTPKAGFPKKNYAAHLPGDWVFPTTQWPKNKIIKDWTLFRLTQNPVGKVDFYAGLYKNGLLVPEDADVPLIDDKLVHLDTTRYVPGSPNIFVTLRDYEEENNDLGVYH